LGASGAAEASGQTDIEKFGAHAYAESAKALKEVGAKTALSIIAAILIYIFGLMLFMPIAEELTQTLFGYPVSRIVSLIIVIALAVIIFAVFLDIRRLMDAMAGVLSYHAGKAGDEKSVENYANYKKAIGGILYVIVVVLAFLLFVRFLADIHRAIPAVLLILIVIWSIFALWGSTQAVAAIIGKYTSRLADELEKKVKQ